MSLRRSHSTADTRQKAGSLRLIGSLALLVSAALVLGSPGDALGAQYQSFRFGSPGSGDGQVELAAHSGLAVNNTSHDVYVADTGNHRIDQFDSSGVFVRAFGADVGGAGIDVCTSGCVAGTPGSAPGSFQTPAFIAVDNSPGASNGDVYVADTTTKVVTKFEADGTLVASWGVGGQLSGNGSEAFGTLIGIAVDASGDLLVMWGTTGGLGEEPGHIFRFAENGSFTSQFSPTTRASEPVGIAVGPSGFFKPNGDLSIEKLESSGTDVGQVTHANFNASLAVDSSSGELYVSRTNPGGPAIETYAFEPSGEVVGTGCTPEPEFQGCLPTDTFGAADLVTPGGLAVDGTTHTVYAADPGVGEIVGFEVLTIPEPITEAPSEVGASEATLNGSVNPNGQPLTACFFEYGKTESYGNLAPCEDPDAAEVGEGSAFVPVHAHIEGLEVGTAYHFRLVAENTSGTAEGDDEALITLGPGIREEAASQVSTGGARITGEVNPNGEASSFVVQYVSEAKFENEENEYAEATTTPLSPKAVGSGSVFVAVSLQLSGLAADTTYHFRIVATNPAATNQGPDKTFTTMAEAPAGLPDGRAYEMVSPPQKVGEVFPPEPLGEIGGSCQVQCLPGTFLPMAPMQASPDGEEVLYAGQPFSTGQASGVDVYLASRGPGGWETESLSSPLFEYEENQGYLAFSTDLSQGIDYQISPALSVDAPSAGGKSYANLYRRQGGVLEALVTQAPPQRTPGVIPTETRFEIAYGGANAGAGLVAPFSHVVFAANDALTDLTAFAPKAPEIEAGQRCRRAFGADCNLYEWSEGELRLVNVLPDNSSTAPRSVIGSRLQENEPPAVERAISDDGSRIFWSDETGQLFVRIDGTETREIKAPGRFLLANPEGTKVLLGKGCLYDVGTELCEDLTGGKEGFQGILGAAEDLSRVYFVDSKILSGEEENENGEKAVEEAGKFNLYLWEGGEVTYLGTLFGDDNSHDYGTWKAASARRTAQVSPDGRFAAFMSKASLTGYDNNASSGGPCRKHTEQLPLLCKEVFEYDAEAEKLVCVSCNPSGQRPIGESNLSMIKETVAIAAAPFPAPHNLTTDGGGRIFFESQDSLSPRDTNAGVQDVYEWEPQGVGSCERAGGCTFLISSGGALEDSMFLGSTPSGDDAFLITREQLVLADRDDLLDLYDARVGGGIPAETETLRAECQGEACQPAATAPNDPTPSSSSFNGAGNVNEKPKHKHRRKKHRRGRHAHKRAAKHNRGGIR